MILDGGTTPHSDVTTRSAHHLGHGPRPYFLYRFACCYWLPSSVTFCTVSGLRLCLLTCLRVFTLCESKALCGQWFCTTALGNFAYRTFVAKPLWSTLTLVVGRSCSDVRVGGLLPPPSIIILWSEFVFWGYLLYFKFQVFVFCF